MIHQYILENFYDHTFMILYILNLILSIIAYKLGFAKKLPILKSAFVYLILTVGMFVLTILFVIIPTVWNSSPLPMPESLIVINIVLGVYRFRLHSERQKNVE